MIKKRIFLSLIFVLCIFITIKSKASVSGNEYDIRGPLQKNHTVSIDFKGPQVHANDNSPNPFLDYRLQVVFTSPSSDKYNVPGFYNGDGKGGDSGKIWTVRFTPLEQGKWTFHVYFQKGKELAIQPLTKDGQGVYFNGTSGSFDIKNFESNAKGFHKKGRLNCSGNHYLQFTNGTYWIKGGADSPEDFLAYDGFSNTPSSHDYISHIKDWNPGDPDWNNGAGKGIIGTLNYLASQKVNSIYFLPMNIGGDGKNVWPYIGNIDRNGNPNNDNLHFDIRKLQQWEIVFNHAQRVGVFLHFVFNEAEEQNKRELDDSKLGIERKLFYREMIARFSHHLALQWNLCEEYDLDFKLSPQVIKSYAGYIHSIDPYHHPITVHHIENVEVAWGPFVGDSLFCMASLQTRDIDAIKKLRKQSEDVGYPIAIGLDELFPDVAKADNTDRYRREYIWPIYFAGAQLELILEDLLQSGDFRKYELHWQYLWYARKFLEQNVPFWEMSPMDDLLTGELHSSDSVQVSSGNVFAKEGEVYAVYLPKTEQNATLDLSAAPIDFIQRWYNPRTGEFEEISKIIKGGNPILLGLPPKEASEDWVVLLTQLKK